MAKDGKAFEFMDQIIEDTLQALSENPVFDDETLRQLKQLAGALSLTNDKKVVEALSTAQGE